jgi:3'-5' exoribonuclease
MKSPFVNEVEPNRVITTSFLVYSKEIRQKKSGEVYLSLLLGDKTGELDAKMWDNVADVVDSFDRDDFVKVKGLIQVFHNRPQLTIHKMRRMDSSEIDFADYFPCSRRDPAEMWAELRAIVCGIGNPHLKRLLEAMLDDPEIAERYRRAPAAKQIHHAYLGGLLEHVLSLCALARMTAGHYENLDRDLLLAGVVLHDIGKIYELNYERGFSYSNDGQLVGHIAIALRMLNEKLRGLSDFPPLLRSLVEHMILSHHGQLEFGSPKLPQFPEALLLHYIDDMDSKMACMRALIERDRQVEGCFTTYNAALARPALKMDRYLGVAGVPQANPAQAPRSSSQGETSPSGRDTSPPSPDRHGAAASAETSQPAMTPALPPQPAIPPALAAHPLFASRPNSVFADKLQQALRLEDSAEPKQEG